MSKISQTLFALMASAVVSAAAAQTDADHAQHHPAGPNAAKAAKPSASCMGKDQMSLMEKKMNAMQDMHAKMMAAQSPEEKQALMLEHQQLMQEGMCMMKMMKGMHDNKPIKGNMSDRQNMMEKRMEMMENMMQLMMDRMPVPAAQ
jgi:hypothetical protein